MTLLSDRNTFPFQDVEHARLADAEFLSDLQSTDIALLVALDNLRAKSFSDAVFAMNFRMRPEPSGRQICRASGVELYRGQHYQGNGWNQRESGSSRFAFVTSITPPCAPAGKVR
nr:hypothetical protein [Aeromicrobium sp. Root344]